MEWAVALPSRHQQCPRVRSSLIASRGRFNEPLTTNRERQTNFEPFPPLARSTSGKHARLRSTSRPGTGLHRLTQNGSDDIMPAWSPSEEGVVYFLSNRGGAYNIWRFKLSTGTK